MSQTPSFYDQFRAAFPEVARHYTELGDACRSAGPMDERTAELVKLGMSIAAGAEGGSHSHARRAMAAGASRAEVEQVALLGITTLGFPRAMTGLAWIHDVMETPKQA